MDNREIPARCRECARPRGPAINAACEYCGRLEFYEETLCDLNRAVQKPETFKCSAFQPILRVVNGAAANIREIDKQEAANSRRRFFLNLLDTHKYKYLKALALQMLEEDPDAEIINLRYHIVWNTAYRKPIFYLDNTMVDYVHQIFQENSTLIGGFVYLLWVSRDHIHAFVESDGKAPIEEVINKIKNYISNAMLDKYPDLKDGGTEKYGIWDEGYFVESIG